MWLISVNRLMDRPATRDELIKAVERLSDLVESQREHIDSLTETLTLIRERFESGDFVDVSKPSQDIDREEESREIGGELNDIETRKIVKASARDLSTIAKALGSDQVVEVTRVEGSTRSSLIEARERIRGVIREAAEKWEASTQLSRGDNESDTLTMDDKWLRSQGKAGLARDRAETYGALSMGTSSKDLDKPKPIRLVVDSEADFDLSAPYAHNTHSEHYH